MLELKKVELETEIIKVHETAHKIWPDAFKDILTEQQIVYMLDKMYSMDSLNKQMQLGSQFYLIKTKGLILGYFSVEFNYEMNVTQIHKIYLNPNNKGKGYGKKSFNFITELARKKNQKILQLNVNRFNKKAINFYLAYGFTIVKEANIEIGNGFLMEDYVMQKALL